MLYPSQDTGVINYYNSLLERAMSTYCFLDIDYKLSTIDNAMVIIDPCSKELYPDSRFLGITIGSIHRNPELYFPVEIHLSCMTGDNNLLEVLTHEIYHALTIGNYHNIDPESLMYETYNPGSKLTRQDSLFLFKTFNFTKYAKLR